ncbi:MAG: hypothetical protein ACOCUS_03555 [Polyangiales bacterium]
MSPEREHLTDEAVEALAHGREDLVGQEQLAHVDECAECAARVGEEQALSESMETALREATPAEVPGLDAMVSRAMTRADEAEAPQASRWGLAVAAAVGLVAAIGTGALWLAGVASAGDAVDALRDAVTVAGAANRLVAEVVPGGWTAIAAAGCLLLVMMALPMRALVGGSWRSRGGPGGGAAAGMAVLLAMLAGTPTARALDFEGQWPESERTVSVSVQDAPASEALREAAESAGLGVVAQLPDDPKTTLHVSEASLREVVQAVLGPEAPVVARRTENMLVIRPVAQGEGEADTEAKPEAGTGADAEAEADAGADADAATGAVPEPPEPPKPRGSARDRVTFGGDVHVRPDEVVRDVVTMGGDVIVEGEVLRDVVTMGGDLTVRRGGKVHGDMVTMGGEVEVEEGASPPGGHTRFGGGDLHVDRSWDHGPGFVHEAVGSASKHALLFLLGLLLIGLAPARLRRWQQAIVRSPVRSGAAGLLGLVAAAVLCVVLAITIIGIPGAILVALGAFVGFYVGIVCAATVVGAALPLAFLRDRPVLQLLAGMLLLFLVSLVPVAGTIATLTAAALGFGALLLTRLGKQPAT